MNRKTRKLKCYKSAKETLARVIKARTNKRYKVVGRRIPTKNNRNKF